jgi:hypothetical protein
MNDRKAGKPARCYTGYDRRHGNVRGNISIKEWREAAYPGYMDFWAVDRTARASTAGQRFEHRMRRESPRKGSL